MWWGERFAQVKLWKWQWCSLILGPRVDLSLHSSRPSVRSLHVYVKSDNNSNTYFYSCSKSVHRLITVVPTCQLPIQVQIMFVFVFCCCFFYTKVGLSIQGCLQVGSVVSCLAAKLWILGSVFPLELMSDSRFNPHLTALRLPVTKLLFGAKILAAFKEIRTFYWPILANSY